MEPPVPADSLIAPEGPGVAARAAARAGIYVHVPFCATRCTYCDFATDTLTRVRLTRWVAALECEIDARAEEASDVSFTSVFFGGGTPSVLPSRLFTRIVQRLRDRYRITGDAEFTIEANPESVRESLLDAWRSAGVNRLSLGVQSFDAGELRTLGRIHDEKRPTEAVAMARRAGFERISLDLMYGYPGHTKDAWRRTLDVAFGLAPGHLSAYCFIPERGTPLGNAVQAGRVRRPSDAEQARRFTELAARCSAAGLGMYETSNFCRPGEEARHNLVYWLRRPYLGLGPSAHGLIRGERYANHRDLFDWAGALESGGSAEIERERPLDAVVSDECVMLGLRLATGIHPEDYAEDEWQALASRYGDALERGLAEGRLERFERGIRIPPRNRFVADDVIAWLGTRADQAKVDSPAASSVPSMPCIVRHSQATSPGRIPNSATGSAASSRR